MRESLPEETAGKPAQPALFGFAVKKDPPKPRPKAKRKPPLRRCGRRHWPAVCPDCLEQKRRELELAGSAQLSELPGETFEDIFRGAA